MTSNEQKVGVNCAGCNLFIPLAEIRHIRRGQGFCGLCAKERFGEVVES